MAADRLGPFEVLHRLGSGGMGEVWAARHVDLGSPVAVKVITSRRADSDGFRRAFTDEVRAVARLRHRGVLEVLDYGLAPEGSGFAAGSPYLVMALAERSVAESPPRSWPEIRALLLEVLEALAHAHAHGVVHLDLKPANLLRLEGRVALADFGVAAFVGEALTRDAVRGSAAYMAPEQFAGMWRDYGPWTDLYALGTVAWELLCGDLPFAGADPTTLGNLKRGAPPPRLPPGRAPDALSDWLETMLATGYHDRFARAADAAAALSAIPAAEDVVVDRSGPARAAATLSISTLSETTLDLMLDGPVGSGVARARAPLAETWRSTAVQPALLREALGVGLLGLRPPPFVGREAERDRLWAALLDVARRETPGVALIEGSEGAGASALGRWVATRADELGVATAVIAGPDEEHADLWRRMLGLQGLDQDAIVAQLVLGRYRLGEGLARSVATLVRGEAASATERLGTQVALLEALSRDRTIALVLDALDDDEQNAELAAAVAARTRGPVWVVLTVRSERRLGEPAVAAQVARLDRAGALRVPVGPLTDEEARTLVERWLHVEGHASAALVERAAGNPGVLQRELVRWVERGILRPGPMGHALVGQPEEDGSDAAAWADRLDAVVGLDPVRIALVERAAAVGEVVVREIWADGPDAVALEDDLVRRGLAVVVPGGWSFAHPELRQVVARRARGTWVDHHRAIADRLATLGPRYAWRRGQHLFEGELWEQAVVELLDQVIHAWGRVHVQRVRTSIHKAAVAAEHLPDPASWRRRVAGVEALFAVWGGRYDEALRVADSVIADEAADARSVARALRARGMVRQLRGDLAAAVEDLERATAMIEAEGEPDLACEVAVAWMHALLQQGRVVEARQVVARFRPTLPRQLASADAAAGILATYEGDFARGLALLQRALGRFRELGYRIAVAGVLSNVGDAFRHLGDLDAAEAPIREAVEIARQHGLGTEPVMRLNLVQLLIAQGRADDAWDEVQVAIAGLERLGRRGMLGAAHAVALRVVAMRGDWERWDHHFGRSRELLEGTGLDEPEVAEAFREAERLAAAAGR